MRLRHLGLITGSMPTGPRNEITDVPGVRVGHSTIIRGAGALRTGRGPVRTGVTAVIPTHTERWDAPLFAGAHTLNGTGEWTGLRFIEETGHLYGPIMLTNSHSVGTVRDAVIRRTVRSRSDDLPRLPVVGETYDGILNDIAGMHVTEDHVAEALEAAGTIVQEGSVGGGTGMISFGFKGGIGTSSRRMTIADREYVLGVLVQANNGSRRQLVIGGAPVGQMIPEDVVPLPGTSFDRDESVSKNSILVIVATNAPLLPHQLRRVAQRATLGIAVAGATAHPLSGDYALAFSTANAESITSDFATDTVDRSISALSNSALTCIFDAAVEATAESIANALLAAEDMTGRDGNVAFSLPIDALVTSLRTHFTRARDGLMLPGLHIQAGQNPSQP